MFIFDALVTDLSGICRPAALRLWPKSIPTKDKQFRSEALIFKKVSDVTLGRLDLG